MNITYRRFQLCKPLQALGICSKGNSRQGGRDNATSLYSPSLSQIAVCCRYFSSTVRYHRYLVSSVSKAELQSIIDAGVHPMLQQTPFRNPQTGAFDKDMLKKFLVDYSKMNTAQMPAQYAEYYQSMYKFWSFLEKQLVQTRLAEKYQALVSKSLLILLHPELLPD